VATPSASSPRAEDLPKAPRERPWEFVRRWWRSRNRHHGLRYWLIFWGLPLVVLYAALFTINGFLIGWQTAYDVTLAIDSPGDVTSAHTTFWAWPLSVAGWLAMPGVAGAVAGYVVNSSITRRRSSSITDKYAIGDNPRFRRKSLALDLIPLLKELISRENDFGLSYEFVPRFVCLAHKKNYRLAQNHWERYVSDMLDTDLLKGHETGIGAMHHAVKGAVASLMAGPLRDTCPICGEVDQIKRSSGGTEESGSEEKDGTDAKG
jgi:uncharacterized protein DUF6313